MPRYAVVIRTCTWTTHRVDAETPADACEEAMTTEGADDYTEFDGISQIVELDPESETEGTDHPVPPDWIRT